MNRHGYTLLEMMIVLFIMLIVALLTVPALVRRLPLHRRDAAVSRLVAELRAARVAAITESRAANVELDAAAKTLKVMIDRNGNLTNETSEVTTIAFATDDNMTVEATGSAGAFDARGMFSSTSGAWRVEFGTGDWDPSFVYVFQSGQVLASDEKK